MNSFLKRLKENQTLAFGLFFPIMLAAVLLGAHSFSQAGAPVPKYDLVFYTNNPYGTQGLAVQVQNRKASAQYTGTNYSIPQQRIYVYHPADASMREIPITWPDSIKPCDERPAGDCNKHVAVPVPELEALTLDNHPTAPDGYTFIPSSSAYSHDYLCSGVLFAGNHQPDAILRKDRYRMALPYPEGSGRYGEQIYFIGWVIPP